MKKKFLSIFIALVLALSLCLVTATPVAAQDGTPAIDGAISSGEWDGATSFQIGSYTGYVTNDGQYMYVAYDYAIKTVGEWANIITYRAGLTPEKTYISWVFMEETGLEPQRWTVQDTHTVTVDGEQGEKIPDGLFTPFEIGIDDPPVFVDTVDVAGAKKTNLVYAVDSATEMAIPLTELGLTPGSMFPSGGDSIKIMPGINTLPNTIFVYPDSETEEDDLTIMWSWDPNNYADYTLWVPLYNLEITIAGQGQVTYTDPDIGLVEKSGDGTTWTMSYKAGTMSDTFTAQTWDQYPNWEFVHWTVHTSTDDIISPEPTGAIPIFEDLSVTATFAPEPVEVWVDNGFTSETPGWETTHWDEIQEGIDAVAEDGTVSVAAGTYNEVVTIDKSLTLLGAKAGVDARTRTFNDESVLDGTGLTPVVGVGAFNILDGVSNVIIDGFEVCDYESANDGGGSAVLAYSYGGTQTQGLSNITIQNNYLHDVGWNGVCVWSNNGVVQDNFTIQFNLIEEAPYAGIELTNVTNSQVLNNKVIAPTVIVDDPRDAGVGIEIAARAHPGISISAGTDILVEGNEITGAFPERSRAGINILSRTYASDSNATLTGVTVRGNTVSGVTNIWAAILAVAESRDEGPATITNLAVEDNILVGNSWAGICVEQRGGGTLDSITVSGNTLENNIAHVYVYDGAEVLEIQAVLDSNTFDRTVVVDHLGSLQHVIAGSINEGCSWAQPGDTVLASPGTYDEAVVINRPITLQGAGDATVIKPSSESKLTHFRGLNPQEGALFNNDSVAGIVNGYYFLTSDPIIIKDLKVDGGSIDAAHPIADYIAGIFGLGMNGTIDNVTVVNMDTSTEQPRTYGIWLDSVLWDASVEVKNCTITSYNKNGINARGAKLTVNIHDNTITGSPSDIQCPNGILLANGVTGEVNNNTISNMAYTPETWWSMGILFWESSGPASGNTITDCQVGICYQDGGGAARGNTVNGGTVGLAGLWAQYTKAGTWTVSFEDNTVTGIKDSILPWECAAMGAQSYDAGVSIALTIDGNQLTGGGATNADGIYIGDVPKASPAGSIVATIKDNTISGWQKGIRLLSSVAPGSTITKNTIANNISPSSGIHIEAGVDATNVSVNFNNIVGNQGYGVYNGATQTLDATTNWWGDATGPQHAILNPGGLGNAASDNVTFSPWLYPPTVVTATASSLSTTSATLNGSLDDLGSALSVAVSFEWGLTTGYGNIVAVTPLSEAGVFSAIVSGLSDGTTYHFRAKAVGDGPDVYGDDITFATKAKRAPAPPTYYVETNLLGIEASFRISKTGEILKTIEATSEDGMLTITIPKGTIALGKDGKRLETLEAAVDETPPDPPADANIIGLAYDFGPDGATFDPPITLTFSYDPDALPEGVAEEDLVLAYYDQEAGEWVELDCVVDTVNNVITASVPHFTTFAIIGVVPPVVVPPAPARFTISSLGVLPSELAPGEEVNISVLVANTGGKSGSYTVVLKIDGVKESEERVTIAAGSSRTVSFSVTKEEADSYTVAVNGLSGSFTVAPVVVPPEPAAFSVAYLSFSPLEVEPGEAVTVTVLVANIGGESGSYPVVLKIDGIKEAEETVTIAAGESQEVSFSATKEEAGSYTVTVDGWSGSFTVVTVAPPAKPGFNWPLIGGIIGGVIVVALLIFFFIRRRAAY